MKIIDRLLPTPPDFPSDRTPMLRRNLNLHIGDGAFYVFGMSFTSFQTIFPIFIKELGGNTVEIGSVQVLWTLGANIPAVFVAQYLKRISLFSPAMVKWGFVHRFILFLTGVTAALLIGKVSASVTVPLFLFLWFLTAMFGSIAGLPWFQVFTKTVPVQLRGRLMGIRQLLGSIGGIVAGSLVGIILSGVLFPFNYSILFFSSFLLTMVSFSFLTRLTEEKSAESFPKGDRRLKIFEEAKQIIRGDRNYRHYLVADSLNMTVIAAGSFYAVYALEKFSLPSWYAGTFTAIVMVSSVVANIVFGITADLYGHKKNLLAYSLCMGLAAVLAVVSPNIFIYGFVFVFLSCAVQIQAISRSPFVAEMCREQHRPVYVGIANTLASPALLVGILFGWLVPKIGFAAIFTIIALLALSSFYILHTFVLEPRFNKQS